MKVERSTLQVPNERKHTLLIRSMAVGAIGILLFGGLVFRLYQLQILDHERYETRARENRLVTQPIAPARGLIYDRNGIALARNRQVQSLSVVGENVDDIDALLERIREILDFSEDEEESFRKRLKVQLRPRTGEKVTLKRHLNDKELAIFAVNRYRYPDVFVTTETLREYPLAELMAHVVGSVRQVTTEDLQRLDPVRYAATKYVGRRAIEKFYESELHGQVGHRTVEVNVHGRVMRELSQAPPLRGRTLTLHVDTNLQRVADEELGDRRGAVVAIDPNTGGILSLVSKPTYDPNFFVMGMTDRGYSELIARSDTPLFNRATQGTYPPGSTFKPVIGLAGLSLGATDWEHEISDPRGEFRLPNVSRIWRDWDWTASGSGGQGKVDLYRAIYRSSNVYFYDLSTRLHVDDLASFAAQFGYGRATAIDVADPALGLMPTTQWKKETLNDEWYPGDTVNLAIGQGGMMVTPLQIATAATVVANRGKWVRPRLLLSSDPHIELDEGLTQQFPPVEGPTDEDWDLMIEALKAVVHRGARGFKQNGLAWADLGMDISFEMAGKSGTAQVVEIPQGEEYNDELLTETQRKHALFFAFSPPSNPVIVVAVVVEHGGVDGGGTKIAGPIAKKIIETYLNQSVALSRD